MLLLTDLDTYPCAGELIADWLRGVELQPGFLFRVAVREVEAWLLADREGIAGFLAIPVRSVPDWPEALPDPKASLIHLASTSRRREVRERLVAPRGSSAQIGREYNDCLSEFVFRDWNYARATERAPSLARAGERLRGYQPRWKAER
jgi:hypothetical protein